MPGSVTLDVFQSEADTELWSIGHVSKSSTEHAEISAIASARFERALHALYLIDPVCRVALHTDDALAVGLDGTFPIDMPIAARTLPSSDRAAAAAVLFLDKYGALFGIPGWHALSPTTASPLGTTIWFTFNAEAACGEVTVRICADDDVIRAVRIERSAASLG